MYFIQRIVCFFLGIFFIHSCFAFDFKEGEIPLQLGLFQAKEGMPQLIRIQGLLGNQYTTTDDSGSNGLVGIGYLLPVKEETLSHYANLFHLSNFSYGVNAFYLGKTTVKGVILQEQTFSNLSYQYDVSNVPIYAVVRGEMLNAANKVGLVLHAGIGPNITMLRNYQEASLDGGMTVLNHSFYSNTNTTFSAMGGVGVAIHDLIPNVKLPIECAYRFFYLGQSALNKRTNQIINSLETSQAYAQAIVCSATV